MKASFYLFVVISRRDTEARGEGGGGGGRRGAGDRKLMLKCKKKES